MEYAIVKTGGKQYKVSKDSIIEVERLSSKPGEKFSFEEIILHVVDGKVKLGKPIVKGVVVKAEVLEHFKGEKLRISKFKAKSKYRRVTGHRQYLTKVKILDILMPLR
ncbi:MAG: 50S ribosomal protein L21 [Candidatus Levybacteria bacterium GW2011_GWA2_37_36]|nr:MAG: 50S ribosomal protein L21 [Candidatus Levybacteria bacterium GW2011_GWA1_37_16]KKQ32065.1 MAG: 50S ribosomal protein L21 [Candidatus Levybacteria bacterium GW2011_GWA2_37_36]KKQ38715.1 MAG: 50S ribosomal protein L21 [Candidatus Levybacteria bacterium GW2011_GWC2_37_7]KKQ42648.1 MAG: 50S ribosomal protein L21 [Candidatus Levybacteria bacterium GW2011_GWB1_37_8]OGH51206.1 MAG: 50S ribosomal protein L21 [Candidatus Levybacteria bacterium RIFCSPLOWO2_12_FULL_37_14]